MPFKSFDALRIFDVVARHKSFTAAALELHLTKGAVSYQIKRLENDLGFKVFYRNPGGIVLTEKGRKLWHASQSAFQQLEQQIDLLGETGGQQITIGMSTYFASRWLSSRLMNFTSRFTDIGLRLQPTIGLMDLKREGLDMVIRWGRDNWTDLEIELLFSCPAIATAGTAIAGKIKQNGLANELAELTLLHDFDGSEAWLDWHKAANLTYQPGRNDLVIPDPNVRVQAVIDGQGVALNDHLIDSELTSGRLVQISSVELVDYGYFLAYPEGALDTPALKTFRDWILTQAQAE